MQGLEKTQGDAYVKAGQSAQKRKPFVSKYPQLQLSACLLCLQANARMQQIIHSREAEANYTTIVDGVIRLVKDLNSELKQSLLL